MAFHYADYIIFVLFLVISLSIGLYHALRGGKQKTTEEFLMGDRKFHTLPVAISITLSFISAILVLGQPAEVYTRGTQFSVVALGQMAASVFVIIFIVPVFFKLKVTSSFEYLELRYGSKHVKLVGSVVMLICSTIQSGIVLYAPSVALEAVSGIPTWMSITISSVVGIIYTTLGGMKAVIWTDVFQGGCVIIGMIVVVIQGTIKSGGPSEVWNRSSMNNRVEFFNVNPDPTIRTTFWSAFVNGIFVALTNFGVGQTTVQRYCALPSLAKARCSMAINTCLVTIIVALATSVGLVIFAYYDVIGCDPLKAKKISNANQILPYFVMDVLSYPGFLGLFLSVLYGGALSTLSSTLNSAAAVTWQDMIKNYLKHLEDSKRALVTKILVVFFGVITIALAFLAKYLGPHVLQAITVVSGTLAGPLTGIFIMGMFFKCANSKGAIVGCITGITLTSWIAVGSIVTNRHSETLPTNTDSCYKNITEIVHSNFSSVIYSSQTEFDRVAEFRNNTTLSIINASSADDARQDKGINILLGIYSLSYLLYPLIGFLVTLIIGISISLVTGGLNQSHVDSSLLARCGGFNRSVHCSIEPLTTKDQKQMPVEIISFWKENGMHKSLYDNEIDLCTRTNFFDIPLN